MASLFQPQCSWTCRLFGSLKPNPKSEGSLAVGQRFSWPQGAQTEEDFLGSSRLLWAVQAGQWSRTDRTGVDREGKHGQSRVDCRETMQAGQGQEQKGDEQVDR